MLLALLTAVSFAQVEPLTLRDALVEALAHNPELRQQEARLGRSGAMLVMARSRFDPTLEARIDAGASSSPNNVAIDGTEKLVSRSSGWSAGLNQALPTGATAWLQWSETYSASNSANLIVASTYFDRVNLGVSQPLLDGFGAAALYPVRSARLALDDESLVWRGASEQLVLDVSARYWRMVSARESLQLAIRSREIAEQSLADTRERHAEGFAGLGDVHQVRRAVGTARQAEVVAVAELEAAEASLKRVLGRDVSRGAAIHPVDLPRIPEGLPTEEGVLAQARSGNVQWLRDRLALERARLDVGQARNAALPDLRVNGSVGFAGLGESPLEARQQVLERAFSDWGLGASVSVPLPGRPIRAQLATAKLDQTAARVALEAAEQDLVLRVQDAVRALIRDRSRVELARETVDVARLALEADQELLRDGKGSTRNVVISLEALDLAQVASLQAQIDLQASVLELERVAGTLLEHTIPG